MSCISQVSFPLLNYFILEHFQRRVRIFVRIKDLGPRNLIFNDSF